jgi:adenylate cyclase
MGDNVNVASRLEGMAKLYAVDIVFSDAVRADAGDIPAIELDVVQVKGRAAPTRLFTVPPDGLVASPEFDRFAATHAAMLASYRTQDWPAARAALAECRTIDVSGTLHPYYAVMAARIDTLEADPPPADWGGVYIADSK